MIEINKKSGELCDRFNDVKFIARALGLDARNEVFHYIHVDDKKMWATDARRLHMTDRPKGMKQGAYRVVSDKAGQIILDRVPFEGQVPNRDQVIPKGGEKIASVEPLPVVGISKAIAAIYAARPGLCVNLDYVKDAVCDAFDVFFSDMHAPLLFQNHTKTAVIMPMMLNK